MIHSLTPERYDIVKELIRFYLERCDVYINLSIGMLALSVIFYEKIIGKRELKRPSVLILSGWTLLIIATGTGTLYQYIAVQFLDVVSPVPGNASTFLPEFVVLSPGRIFAAMLISFYLGSIAILSDFVKNLLLVNARKNKGSELDADGNGDKRCPTT